MRTPGRKVRSTGPDEEMTEDSTDPKAGGDKPASDVQGEPLKGEVSRTGLAWRRRVGRARVHPRRPQPRGAGCAKPARRRLRAQPARPRHTIRSLQHPSGPSDPPPPAGAAVPAYITSLQAAIPGGVEQVSFFVGDWTVIVPAAKLLEVGTLSARCAGRLVRLLFRRHRQRLAVSASAVRRRLLPVFDAAAHARSHEGSRR